MMFGPRGSETILHVRGNSVLSLKAFGNVELLRPPSTMRICTLTPSWICQRLTHCELRQPSGGVGVAPTEV